MRKNLLSILGSLQKTVNIYAVNNNIDPINYPKIYPYKSNFYVPTLKIYNDILQLNFFLRHPQLYYLNRHKEGEPTKINYYKN